MDDSVHSLSTKTKYYNFTKIVKVRKSFLQVHQTRQRVFQTYAVLQGQRPLIGDRLPTMVVARLPVIPWK